MLCSLSQGANHRVSRSYENETRLAHQLQRSNVKGGHPPSHPIPLNFFLLGALGVLAVQLLHGTLPPKSSHLRPDHAGGAWAFALARQSHRGVHAAADEAPR